jgi:hypothetical protein
LSPSSKARSAKPIGSRLSLKSQRILQMNMRIALLLLTAILLSFVQVSTIVTSSDYQELGLFPIARVDYQQTHHPDIKPRCVGFFLTVGLVGLCCFAAGRLSNSPRSQDS